MPDRRTFVVTSYRMELHVCYQTANGLLMEIRVPTLFHDVWMNNKKDEKKRKQQMIACFINEQVFTLADVLFVC